MRMDPEVIEALHAYAAKQGKTASDIVRDLVEQELKAAGYHPAYYKREMEGQISMQKDA